MKPQEFVGIGEGVAGETKPFSQTSRWRGSYQILGFFWVYSGDIVYITSETIELYKVWRAMIHAKHEWLFLVLGLSTKGGFLFKSNDL